MTIKTGDQHEAFRVEMIAVLRKHIGPLPPVECYATACAMVGQMLAVLESEGKIPADHTGLAIAIANIAEGRNAAMVQIMAEWRPN